MSHGGFREGAGRKPGSRDLRTVQLENAMLETGVDDFVGALVAVVEDEHQPEKLRIDACQTLAGRMMGGVLAPSQLRKKFSGASYD
tara:strand:+ start:5013 stop:5270 length:258 start_codon:yes stop_codon:yes gene_type:complete